MEEPTTLPHRRRRLRHHSGPRRRVLAGGATIVSVTLAREQLQSLDRTAYSIGINRSELISRLIDVGLGTIAA